MSSGGGGGGGKPSFSSSTMGRGCACDIELNYIQRHLWWDWAEKTLCVMQRSAILFALTFVSSHTTCMSIPTPICHTTHSLTHNNSSSRHDRK